MTSSYINITLLERRNKLKRTNSLKHRGGNGRPGALSEKDKKKAIDQYIRRNNEITEKLSTTYHSSVFAPTIRLHLHEYGYRNIFPKNAHMLASIDIKLHVQWAKQHKNEIFTRTIFKRKV